VLIFLDADVTVDPRAVVSLVESLRTWKVGLVSAFPQQRAESMAERVCQPMVGWAWMSLLPTTLAENPRAVLTTIANGQIMVFDAARYRELGGHVAVAGEIVEDIGLMKAAKRARIDAVPAIGTDIAACRMYGGTSDLIDGYAKNIAVVLGSPVLTCALLGLIVLSAVVPPVMAVTSHDRQTRAWGAAGYAAAVAGRVVVARHTGDRVWPDVLAHPATVAAFAGLALESFRRRHAGTATWKGRVVSAGRRT
jgi:hypothetical protein